MIPSNACQTSNSLSRQPLALIFILVNSHLLLASLPARTYPEDKIILNFPESLRLHPPLPFLFRTCTTTYTTSDGLTIPKGSKVVIPSLSIHMDPKFYPEPEVFRPERFDPDQFPNKYIWLPFGEGPRKCLGKL